MRARVVPDRPWTSFVLSVALTYLALGMLALLPGIEIWIWDGYGLEHIEWFRNAIHTGRAFVLLAFLAAAVAPWLVMFRRSRSHPVVIGADGLVRIGSHTFAKADVTGASVAPYGGGVSVAIGRGERATFVEMDRLEEARRLLDALGARFPQDGSVLTRVPRGSFVFVQGIFTVISLLYAAFMVTSLLPLSMRQMFEPDPFIAVGFLLTLLTVLLVALRVRRPMRLSWSAATMEVASRRLDRSPRERHIARHLTARFEAAPPLPRVRIELLEKGTSATSDWLARIDALAQGGAYRGDTLPNEALWDIVGDDACAVDVRVASARLLARDAGADEVGRAKIVAAVADEEVRRRVETVLRDASAVDAAEQLDAVGPLFQTG